MKNKDKIMVIGVILSLTYILGTNNLFSQNTDSLWAIYNNKSQPDTVRLRAINSMAWSFVGNNPDTAIVLSEQQITLANTIKSEPFVAKALSIIGASYMYKNNYPKSLEYYLKSLKIRDRINDKNGVISCYNSIGYIYLNQSDYTKALDYLYKSLKISEEINDKQGIAYSYSNIGSVYYAKLKYQESLESYSKALKICEEISDKNGMESCYGNIGNSYRSQGNYTKALENYLKQLSITNDISDKQGAGICYGNIGTLYLKLNDYNKAIQYSDSALQATELTGSIDAERTAYENLALAYSKTGDYKQAYEYQVKFKQSTDSIFNTNNSKEIGDLKTQFEVEKKEAELKIKSEAQQEKQNVIIYSVIGVLSLVIIFSLFLFSRFRITKRQKIVIEQQKLLVDKAFKDLHEKNDEVMASIRYAKRIQATLLPTEKYIDNNLKRLMKK